MIVNPCEILSQPFPDGEAILRSLQGRRVEEMLHLSLIDRRRVLRSPAVIAARIRSVPISLLVGLILLLAILGMTVVSLLNWLARLILR